jgi:hypothetical protein
VLCVVVVSCRWLFPGKKKGRRVCPDGLGAFSLGVRYQGIASGRSGHLAFSSVVGTVIADQIENEPKPEALP